MLTPIIIAVVVLLILAGLVGVAQFIKELEEYQRRSQEYTHMIDEFEEEEDSHE